MAEDEAMLPAGDWDELNGQQKSDVRYLNYAITSAVAEKIGEFYKGHPELRIGYRLQLEPTLIRPLFKRSITAHVEHDGTLYKGTLYAAEEH